MDASASLSRARSLTRDGVVVPPVDPLEHLDERADGPERDSDGLGLSDVLAPAALAVGEGRAAVGRRVADPREALPRIKRDL